MARAPAWRAALALALAMSAAPALAARPAAEAEAMSLGDPKAKVLVEEYASLSCSHCARFQAEVFPAFKARYVDTGKVRYVLHEFVTPPEAPAIAGWLIARCAGPKAYFKVVDDIFASQSRWTAGGVKAVLLDVARANGMTEAQFDACLTSKVSVEALRVRVERAIKDKGIAATPTFAVNGQVVKEGEMTLGELDAAIAAARR